MVRPMGRPLVGPKVPRRGPKSQLLGDGTSWLRGVRTLEPLKNGGNTAENASMSHRCWNCGQRVERGDVQHSGVMTAPRVYLHRVGQRHQRGYGLWGTILGAVAVLWFLGSVVVLMAR